MVDLTTGEMVAHINGVAFAFSAGDRYVAVSSFSSEVARPGGHGSLVDWRSGRTVWQAGPGQLAIIGNDPDGDAIAVQLATFDAQLHLQQQLLIVRPDGTAIPITEQVIASPSPNT